MPQNHFQSHSPKRIAAQPTGKWHGLLARTAFAGAAALVFVWLLANRLSAIALDDIITHLATVTPHQWLAAGIATCASFWAIGHYDSTVHRYLATQTPPKTARRAGACAIAVSQTLGFGVLTGALLRWRLLPGVNLWQATKITSLVTLFFLLGLGVITAIALLALPQAPFKPMALAGAIAALVLIVISAIAPRRLPIRWPNLMIIARLLALTALDTSAAAIALWLICPLGLDLPFATLLPAFLLAFGAGLISGAPGGVGAFEITLLALLPTVPEPALLAGVLAWRLIYYAIPALVGAGLALLPPAALRTAALLPLRHRVLAGAARAETNLLSQGQLAAISAGYDQAWVSGQTPHCRIGLFDPLAGDPQAGADPCDLKLAITALMDRALAEGRQPVLYKCSARTAVAARQLGFFLRPVAREAWVDPQAFCAATPSRAGLRRKLRRAAQAGVTVQRGSQDWSRLAAIAAEWAANHGGERGFSMGRFDPDYLKTQRLYVAYAGDKALAFASFHIGKYEWTLDLMRHTSCAPDGTMQALVAAAITDAAAQNLARLSLSAVPMAALSPAPQGRAAHAWHHLLGGRDAGLAQFKSAFAPQWQTLYLAAPHRLGLALSAAEIAHAIWHPAALPRETRTAPQHDYDEYEFATARQSWQGKG